MRHYLDELLKALEKSYPDGLKVSDLREKFSSDTDEIIHDAVRGKLIFYPVYHPGGNFGSGDKIYLDVNGFGLLNQMKMKEAVDQLDVSIKGFNESSDKSYEKIIDLTEKLSLSVENLSKSSGRLELLTLLLIVLTVILAISTIYDIFLK
jgi:hypothetical protein